MLQHICIKQETMKICQILKAVIVLIGKIGQNPYGDKQRHSCAGATGIGVFLCLG